jgi:hypothetical protein
LQFNFGAQTIVTSRKLNFFQIASAKMPLVYNDRPKIAADAKSAVSLFVPPSHLSEAI